MPRSHACVGIQQWIEHPPVCNDHTGATWLKIAASPEVHEVALNPQRVMRGTGYRLWFGVFSVTALNHDGCPRMHGKASIGLLGDIGGRGPADISILESATLLLTEEVQQLQKPTHLRRQRY